MPRGAAQPPAAHCPTAVMLVRGARGPPAGVWDVTAGRGGGMFLTSPGRPPESPLRPSGGP